MEVPEPTLIFRNGLVYTVDKVKSQRQVIALTGDKIVFVGENLDADDLIGRKTRVVDLQGKMVLPGFVEAHAHPSHTMDVVGNISLYLLDSEDAYLKAIAAYISENPEAEHFRGSGWSDGLYPGIGPRKDLLDRLAPDRPMAIVSYDGHSTWVNSALLEQAQISKETPDPDGGVIERDPDTGQPSGTLRETAMKLAEKVIPDYSMEKRKNALLAYQEMALQAGITRSYDAMLEAPSIKSFRELAQEGQLKIHFNGAVLVEPGKDIAEQVAYVAGELEREAQPTFKMRSAKIFVDGVIEGGTGYLLEPYEHKPDYCGELIWPQEELDEMVAALDAAGIQIHFHVIGDGAAKLTLDALEAAQIKNGARDSRHLMTHLQLVDPQDIPRFKDLGVIGLPQPFWFAAGDYYWNLALPYLGKERADRQYPMKSFMEAGVMMASSSDFPVTIPFDPLIGIQRGITRSEKGQGPRSGPEEALWPEQRVSLEQMIESFTYNGAYANFEENRSGSLAAGKQADLTILDRNLFEIPIKEIDEVKVLATLVDGEFAYRDASFNA